MVNTIKGKEENGINFDKLLERLNETQRKQLDPLISQIPDENLFSTKNKLKSIFDGKKDITISDFKIVLSPAEAEEIRKAFKELGYIFSVKPLESDSLYVKAWENFYEPNNDKKGFVLWANSGPGAVSGSISPGVAPATEPVKGSEKSFVKGDPNHPGVVSVSISPSKFDGSSGVKANRQSVRQSQTSDKGSDSKVKPGEGESQKAQTSAPTQEKEKASLSDEKLKNIILEYKKRILGSKNMSQELSVISNVLNSQVAKKELTFRDMNKIKKELVLMMRYAFSAEQIQQLKAGESVNLDKRQIDAINEAEGGVNTAVTVLRMQLDALKVKDVSFNPKFDKKNNLESLEVKSFFKTEYPTGIIKVKPEGKTQAKEDTAQSKFDELKKVKEEVEDVGKKVEELAQSHSILTISVADSKKFYETIGLNPDKQDYFFGNIAFGSSKVKAKDKSFNTKKRIDDLMLYLPPAVFEKLKGRPGVTEVKQEEWKEKKNGEFEMRWTFKVNNNAHSLIFTIGKPNEKGFRKVTLLFE